MSRHYTAFISNLFGKFATREFSPKVQRFINNGYVKMVGLDMGAFAPAQSYPTLNKLFTRAFVQEPTFDEPASAILSPCDARVSDSGTIVDGQAYQVKGMEYDTASLLGARYAKDIQKLEGGEYVNLYLSPRDYHRYHMPMDISVLSVTHIPGKLYPVNMPLLKNKLNLFIENERVILECSDHSGHKHYIVLVGALNVGKMVVTFEDNIQTNTGIRQRQYYSYDTPIRMNRSELFGWFEMGSTILLLSEKGSARYKVETGSKVSFGDVIGVSDI